MSHSLFFAIVTLGCVSTPLPDDTDAGARSQGVADVGSPVASSCRVAADGGCLSSNRNVLCCEVFGLRVDPSRRCTELAGGTHGTVTCDGSHSTKRDRACDHPLISPTPVCVVRSTSAGRQVYVVGAVLPPPPPTTVSSEAATTEWSRCEAALETEVLHYPRCTP